MLGRLRRIERQIRFAMGVPIGQIGHRIALTWRRGIEQRTRPALPSCGLTMREGPPGPVFDPRQGLADRIPTGWRFRFVGHEAEMPATIDWRKPGPAGRDQLWRMNLHYMEYLEALDDDQLIDLVDQWIAGNAMYDAAGMGDAWNAYALSLRTVVWMQQLARRRANMPGDFLDRAVASIGQQLRYLERHLELDIRGNHLIKNIKALLWGACFFEGRDAQRWRMRAIGLLDRQLSVQMLADGMHFERSPSYHCQVTADLLEIRHALGTDPLGDKLDRILGRAVTVIADLCHPDGWVAQYSDSGLTMAYRPGECIAAFTKMFGREIADATASAECFMYPDAGYFGVRAGSDYAIIDAGLIAPDTLPAHGHGDMFSLEWSLGGRRVIVDQGVFEYVTGDRRQASRTAACHNTLSILGSDQAQFFGAFRSASRARLHDRSVRRTETGLCVEGTHDGFRRTGGPLHTRRAHLSPGCIRIHDRLDRPSTAPARIAFLLHPEVRVDELTGGSLRLTCGMGAALVTSSAAISLEPAVWWPDMGVELATNRLVILLEPGALEAWVEFAAVKEQVRETD